MGTERTRAVEERIVALRGRLYPFDRLEPERVALIVIDLQNIFMAPGAVYEVPAARGIVANVNGLAHVVRRTGGLVVWVQMTYDPADPWRNFYDHMLAPDRADAVRRELTPGSGGHALWPALERDANDLIVQKTRFSAFLMGSSDIAARLRQRGVDAVLIAGTVTNTFCESSARDAMMMDFKTIMVSDANAAVLEESHTAALTNFLQVLGDVRTTDEVVDLLELAATG